MTFDGAASRALLDTIVSIPMESGYFDDVNSHEPKAPPGKGLTAAVWVQSIMPITAGGLAATSGRVLFMVRCYSNMLQEPQDAIDPNLTEAAAALITAYSADFDLGGTARAIDLLGQYGVSLDAQAGYLSISGVMYRVMDIQVPVIVSDMFTQAP